MAEKRVEIETEVSFIETVPDDEELLTEEEFQEQVAELLRRELSQSTRDVKINVWAVISDLEEG